MMEHSSAAAVTVLCQTLWSLISFLLTARTTHAVNSGLKFLSHKCQ